MSNTTIKISTILILVILIKNGLSHNLRNLESPAPQEGNHDAYKCIQWYLEHIGKDGQDTETDNTTTDTEEEEVVMCPQDVKQCSDGSFVSRGGSNCEFAQCPEATETNEEETTTENENTNNNDDQSQTEEDTTETTQTEEETTETTQTEDNTNIDAQFNDGSLDTQGDNTCPAYNTVQWGACDNNCGSCFNGAARPGKMYEEGQGTGYYSKDEYNFACLDWTFGSKSMQAAEAKFNSGNSDNVYFGVGTFGSSDAMQGIGQCLRMKVEGVDRDLIVQSINTGGDVHGNQFDLMMGNGGMGMFNWCAGSDFSLYGGNNADWGKTYGGWDTKEGCSRLPEYPQVKNPLYDYDNLRDLCNYSFDKKVRGANGENPTILDLARVECPSELYQFTQIKRSDDPTGYSFNAGIRQPGFPNSIPCGQQGLSFCQTRMMDCRKPSGGFIDNIIENKVVEGLKLVQICSNDGYTRMDNRCGCNGCYC